MNRINEKRAIEYYLRKKTNIDEMIINEVVDNGIAFIPCKVSSMNDIMCKYSVEGHETLDEGFADYIVSYADDIPTKYPIALAICGCKFKDEEQKTIAGIIKDYFTYELGLVQKENRKCFWLFVIMTAIMILSGIMLQHLSGNGIVLIEYIYILFWMAADIFFSFIMFDGMSSRKKHILAARLASLFIYFDEKYDESDLTDEEADYIKKEVFSKN